ncbi:hypothetical protein [Paenibacillus tyrfis]|uniref:hypothetical protein n=1 Tax=Paenibacillus tyrfis TaxID=1501230 RepID=UPI000B58D619|nr:hypothetical protein [Paenibacillus tyrfis]
MNDSRNVLTDFDLSLALAQKAINSQMQFAWKAWKKRKQVDQTLDIYPKKQDGTPSKYGLSAVVEPLQVNLNVQNAKLGQVQVTLTLSSGTVHYYDEDQEAAFDQPIVNWSVSFLTDLDKEPVDLNILAQIDPDAYRAASDKMSGLPEDVFSIEYLFMKLTDVELLLEDNKNISIPSNVSGKARTKALECLNHLLQGDLGKFMLGTVVRRNTNYPAPPTFAMTDFVYDVHPNLTAADAATLSYLGVFSGRPLPDDINAARIKLEDNWISPGMIDGTEGLVSGLMAIRKEVFIDKYLMPEFENVLGLQPVVDGLKRSFSKNSSSSNTKRDFVDHKIDQSHGYSLEIAIVPGTNRLDLTGGIDGSFTYTEHTLGPAGMETARITASGHRAVNGYLDLSMPDDSNGAFSVSSQLNYSIGDLQSTKDSSGFGVVENALSWIPKLLGITGGTIEEMLSNIAADNVSLVQKALQNALGHVAIDLNQNHFIPPGGGVFAFQNVRFSNETGDLLFDVIYKAS